MATMLPLVRAPALPVEPPRRPRVEQPSLDRYLMGLLLGVGLVASAWVALRQVVPPDAVPASAAAGEFSAERAGGHLAVIAAAPRFVGSPGHAATRAYLVAEIEKLGLTPEIQTTTSALRFAGASGFSAGLVQNVIARIPGTNSTGAILLNAHYDGGSTGPAAGDCGACVVTLLETVRALRAGPALANDVIVVFSDAEEVGDLGAHAFATQHPWMREVRLALNFESQGGAGPAMLYATSPGNAPLVSAFARTAPRALTSSFFAGLLALFPEMRGACDLQDYMDAGSAGMGFIFMGNAVAYHTRLDDARALDARSVQHFGGYALGLVRHFGGQDLTSLTGGADAIFFNAWPGRVIHYPLWWAVPLAVAAAAILLVPIVRGVRARRIRVPRLIGGTATFAASVVAGVVGPMLLWAGFWMLDPDLRVFMVGRYATGWYVTGLSLLTVAVVSAAWLATSRRLTARDQLAGAVLGFGLLAMVSAVVYPVGSYVFLVPLVASLPVSIAMLAAPAPATRRAWWLRAALVVIAIVPTVMVLVPAGLNGFLGLVSRLEGTGRLPMLALATLFVSLATGLLFPLVRWGLSERQPAGQSRWWRVPIGATVVAFALLAAATVRHHFDADQPRPDQIRYELDANRGEARWVTSDDRLDEWTSQFIPAGTPRERGVRRSHPNGPATFVAPASVVPLAAPELTVLEDLSLPDLRLLRLRLLSRRVAPMLEVRIEAKAPLRRVSVGGQVLDFEGYEPATRGVVSLAFAAPPSDGVDLVVRLSTPAAVRIGVTELSSGIPDIPGWRTPRRPVTTMPAPGGTADGIIVRRTFDVPVRHLEAQ